jgi:hypothetical protein
MSESNRKAGADVRQEKERSKRMPLLCCKSIPAEDTVRLLK